MNSTKKFTREDINLNCVFAVLLNAGATVTITINRHNEEFHKDYVRKNASYLPVELQTAPMSIVVTYKGHNFLDLCNDLQAGFADMLNTSNGQLRDIIEMVEQCNPKALN